MKAGLAICAAAAALLAAGAASAHHSFAMFDQSKVTALKGTVYEFQWTNPHAFIEVDVANAAGVAERWSVELNSPNNLKRGGWKSSTLKSGDKVTVTISPLRDGKKGGLYRGLIFPDGRTMDNVSLTANGPPINAPRP